ncbi:MAG: TetR/AcrR family transcriptional regulator [Rhizobiales bacterium]|nr:TetR/AcrR family transcriptional regulator [Hyphomicrobiales bacterium]
MDTSNWTENIQSRDEQRQIKRMAVLRAAAKLFNEFGYDRTSLDDIAGRLKVSKRTLYYYIKSKDEILFECNRFALKFMNDALEDSKSSDLPALERIEKFFKAYMELLSTDFGACLVLSKNNVLSEESRNFLRQERKKIDVIARELIEEGIAEGSISPCNAAMTTAAIFGAFNWVPHWTKSSDSESYDEIAKHFIHLFINGLKSIKNIPNNNS